MKVIADLHLHSRFARAVSSQMVVSVMSEWSRKKGIDLIATGDWTHPVWLRELQAGLEEAEQGLYKVKGSSDEGVRFLLSTELSSIYSQGDSTRRVHYLVWAPSFEVAGKINKTLTGRGVNLMSDGRPILGLSTREVAQLVFDIDENCLIIPAHVWTPWFSLYGSKSGFDSLRDCFGDLAHNIYAVETGLSSDPAMNWKIEELEGKSIVSFSDAHSPQKLGREATVFELEKLNYESIRKALGSDNRKTRNTQRIRESDDQKFRDPDLSEFSGSQISYTIEFYPEEGKYHYTGHRKCNVVHSPKESRKMGTICPVCGKGLTVGVMSRVESLAAHDIETESETDRFGVRWIKSKETTFRANGSMGRRPYVMLVPLLEIISESLSVGVGTKTALSAYENLISHFGSEFKVLLETSIEDLDKLTDPKIVEGIKKVRSGDIMIEPGYDGVFGKVKIWKDEEEAAAESQKDQETLF